MCCDIIEKKIHDLLIPCPCKVIDLLAYGIIGSPKKNGNVDLLVSEVLRGASSHGAQTQKIYLNDLQIKPCQSCGVNPDPKYCLFDDGMKVIFDALEFGDAIVLGSPVYFDTVSAQTKLMIDRSNCLMPFVQRPNGTAGFDRRVKKRKKGVFIAVAGMDQEFSTIQATIKGFFNWANIEMIETILYHHDDSELGSVRNDKEMMARAFDVGVRIAKQESKKSSHATA
jgi:multimeric flavodoxin WrbA